MILTLQIVFMAMLNFSTGWADSAPCVAVAPECRGSTGIGPAGQLEFYRNYDLNTRDPSITKLTVIVHGVGRNFGNAFARMVTVYSNPADATSTLVVAPHFLADVDVPPSGFLFWAVHGWASGDDSLDSSHISSYEVLDTLIGKILASGNFPNLQQVIITGLSAGGQLTERYAAGSSLESRFPRVHFRYVIASPSSYMYFDSNRVVPGTQFSFAPPAAPACVFNSYRYGLDNRNRYMVQRSASQIIGDFRSRDVVVMVGDQDDATAIPVPPIPNDPKDAADLDVSCPAELEGNSRYERALAFKAYLDFVFPEKPHPLVIGPGIAHQLRLYSTPDAAKWL